MDLLPPVGDNRVDQLFERGLPPHETELDDHREIKAGHKLNRSAFEISKADSALGGTTNISHEEESSPAVNPPHRLLQRPLHPANGRARLETNRGHSVCGAQEPSRRLENFAPLIVFRHENDSDHSFVLMSVCPYVLQTYRHTDIQTYGHFIRPGPYPPPDSCAIPDSTSPRKAATNSARWVGAGGGAPPPR